MAPGFEVPLHYDSMLSKLVAWGETRAQAIDRMRRALTEYEVGGVRTTIPLFRWILGRPDFAAARFDTGFLDRTLAARPPGPLLPPPPEVEEIAVLATAVRAVLAAGADRPASGSGGARRTTWQQAARLGGLRR